MDLGAPASQAYLEENFAPPSRKEVFDSLVNALGGINSEDELEIIRIILSYFVFGEFCIGNSIKVYITEIQYILSNEVQMCSMKHQKGVTEGLEWMYNRIEERTWNRSSTITKITAYFSFIRHFSAWPTWVWILLVSIVPLYVYSFLNGHL